MIDAEDEPLEVVRRVGVFTVGLVPKRRRHYDPEDKLPAHRNVLRPILEVATECWAYDMHRSTAAFRAASDILIPSNRKFRVAFGGDPVSGRERFWNAHSGERGTIVIVVPTQQIRPKQLFSGCYGAWVCDNFLTGHTPSAARFARQMAASEDVIAFCLSRNNGIEWMDAFVNPKKAVRLFNIARKVVRRP